MRHLFLLLLSCIPMLSTAQTLTEAQKQEALQYATKFCNLLVRYSNGERTLDSQINALCSGSDCSAYDDIKTNSEVTLRNYLYAIQTKYPNKLSMTLSTPSFANSKIYIEPIVNIGTEWGSIGKSPLSTTEIASFSLAGVNNAFIVFDVFQQYPSLGKSMNKKIVYDVKNKKITAFIHNNGVIISFFNGLLAYIDNDYKTAMSYFDVAAQNGRSALKKKCNFLSLVCSIYLQDYKKSMYYAEQLKDQVYISMINLFLHSQNGQIESAYSDALQLEALVETRTDLNNMQKSGIYIMLAATYIAWEASHQDFSKALSFIRKADALGNKAANYLIFVNYTIFGDNFVAIDIAYESLRKSAESGYPPAYYHWGVMMEYVKENKAEALRWYEKAAQIGNHVGMASAGKILIERGDKEEGVKLLKKSLEGNMLEAQLEEYELSTGKLASWPQTRADVELLLKTYNNVSSNSISNIHSTVSPSTSASTSSATTSTSSAVTSSTSGSSYDSSSSYNYSRYRHRKFNEAKDAYCVGLSAGYVQKQWTYNVDGAKEKVDVFGEDKYTNGIQFGIRIDPQFGYGFGINTGLYYEFYFDKSGNIHESGIDYNYKSEEHGLYLPVHLKYSLNFSRWFQLAFYGGVGLDYGVSGKIYLRSEGETLESQSLYDDGLDMQRFNASFEYGLAIRINRFQLNYTISNGLVNMSDSDEYKVKQNKLMNISASVCF